MTRAALAASCLALTAAACLDPLSSDELDPTGVFGPAEGTPAMQPHVEDNPDLARNVEQFPRSVAYLKGYADGRKVDYWNVPGAIEDFVVPMFIVVDRKANNAMGRPIIDVLPGDRGYSPWWRRVLVYTTDKYNGERIWSREGVDLAVRMGLLEAPVPTTDVVDCPVVQRDTVVPVSATDTATLTFAWYRNQRVSWVEFKQPVQVPLDVRAMPKYPVYIFQRIDQPSPIYEFLTGVDADGDGRLINSNNVFAADVGRPRYSHLWYVTFVRTVSGYPSIDNTRTATVGIDSEAEIVDPETGAIRSSSVLAVQEVETALVNCPIQSPGGGL